MGREAKRVPLDFDWPVGQLWDGYLMPDRLCGRNCDECDASGYSPSARYYESLWYGTDGVEFTPSVTGSTPYTEDTTEILALAERNVGGAGGSRQERVRRAARNLADMFNSQWCHHLDQEDVDALLAAGRLTEFTHHWDEDARKQVPIEPTPEVTADRVNRWSIRGGLGHDGINEWVCVKARCQRLGVPSACHVCDGRGTTESYPGQRADANAWKPTEPPTGDGWQLWCTTSEGEPMTPVFATPEELARYCADEGVSLFGDHTADFEKWMSIITGGELASVEVAPGVILM